MQRVWQQQEDSLLEANVVGDYVVVDESDRDERSRDLVNREEGGREKRVGQQQQEDSLLENNVVGDYVVVDDVLVASIQVDSVQVGTEQEDSLQVDNEKLVVEQFSNNEELVVEQFGTLDNQTSESVSHTLCLTYPFCDGEEGVQLLPLQSIATGGQFSCKVCTYTAGSSGNLTRHHESLHSETMVSCPRNYCNQVLPTKFMMLRHLAECFLYCNWENCEKKFKYRKGYESHVRGHRNIARRLV